MATKLKCQNTLALHSFTLSLINSAVGEIQKLPEYKSKRLDNELTKAICKFVRDEIIASIGVHLTYGQASSLDKKAIIVEALQKCFDLTDDEAKHVSSQVEFFLDNHLIKRKLVSTVIKAVWSLFPKAFKK